MRVSLTLAMSFSTPCLPKAPTIVTALAHGIDERTRTLNEAEHEAACHASEACFYYVPDCGCGVSRWVGDDARGVYDFDRYSFPGAGYHGTDATSSPPFGAGDLARISRMPLLSSEDCASMITEAEVSTGWTGGSRTASYARRAGTSHSIVGLPRALSVVNKQLLPRLLPAAVGTFPAAFSHASSLRLLGAQIVKYNASAGQRELGMHRDGPVLTATVALNNPREYDGGGTLVEALGCSAASRIDHSAAEASAAFRVETGHAVLHPGGCATTLHMLSISCCRRIVRYLRPTSASRCSAVCGTAGRR